MTKIKTNLSTKKVEITTTLDFTISETENITEIITPVNATTIIDAFQEVIINSLQARQKACLKKLLKHEDSIVSNNGYCIIYKKANGTFGDFHTPSYEMMDKAISYLRNNCYKEFLGSKSCVDQTIKALLNDPNLDRSDRLNISFSKLVSLLCEVHMF